MDLDARFPDKLHDLLFSEARYKVAYGGRGAAKSWNFARALLILGAQKPLRILCARETGEYLRIRSPIALRPDRTAQIRFLLHRREGAHLRLQGYGNNL